MTQEEFFAAQQADEDERRAVEKRMEQRLVAFAAEACPVKVGDTIRRDNDSVFILVQSVVSAAHTYPDLDPPLPPTWVVKGTVVTQSGERDRRFTGSVRVDICPRGQGWNFTKIDKGER